MKLANSMIVKRILTLPVLAAAMALGAGAWAADESRTYDLTGFDKLEIAGIYEIAVTAGKDFSVRLAGEEEELERVTATVENGTLVLGKGKGFNLDFGDKSITATISMPKLTALSVSGVVDGEVTGIDADAFSLDLSGVGDLTLSGNCNELSIEVSGIGDLDAEELRCKSVDIDVSGIGDAGVYASEFANASVSGLGEIAIYGSPAKVIKSDGFLSEITVR